MDSRSSTSQLDETASKSRMRFVDVVRIAGFGVLGAASPWVAWALLATILPLLGYRWDFFNHFPAAKISVPTSLICGLLHALAEWRSLMRWSQSNHSEVELAARQYFESHGHKHLRSEHIEALAANAGADLWLSAGQPRRLDWEKVIGESIDDCRFCEVTFCFKRPDRVDDLARLLVEVNHDWRSERSIYAVWYPQEQGAVSSGQRIDTRQPSSTTIEKGWLARLRRK